MPVFPLFLLVSAALVGLWMVLVVLQWIRVARVIEALTTASALVTAILYVSRWGVTWPRW